MTILLSYTVSALDQYQPDSQVDPRCNTNKKSFISVYKPTSDAAECSLSSDLLYQDIMIDGNRNAVQPVTPENI